MACFRNSDQIKSHRWSLIVIVLSVGAILINMICFSLVLGSHSDQGKQVTDDTSLVCVDCHTLYKITATEAEMSVLNKLHRTMDGDTEKCCARSPQQLTDILDLCLGRKSDSRSTSLKTKREWDTAYSSASAHKCVLPSAGSAKEQGLQFMNSSTAHLTLDATSQEQLVEHIHNMETLTSGLRILYSGMYYVYSEVFYNPRSVKPCSEFAVKTWTHTVVRARPNERQSSGVILSSLHTCCDDCKSDKETSYTGGVFQLEAGDHLHVEVSGYGLVSFHRDASFVGATMLGYLNSV